MVKSPAVVYSHFGRDKAKNYMYLSLCGYIRFEGRGVLENIEMAYSKVYKIE